MSRSHQTIVLSEPEKILIQQGHLCMQSPLPVSFTDLNDLLWTAFKLGKQYRDAGGKG